jgi:hypothetical protein
VFNPALASLAGDEVGEAPNFVRECSRLVDFVGTESVGSGDGEEQRAPVTA